MKPHPYVTDVSGKGDGSCVTCGQHLTHEVHFTPLSTPPDGRHPYARSAHGDWCVTCGWSLAEGAHEAPDARTQLAEFIAAVDVALGGSGVASPERVLEKARSLAACAPSAMHAAVHGTAASAVVHHDGPAPRRPATREEMIALGFQPREDYSMSAASLQDAMKGRPLTPEEAAKPALVEEPLPSATHDDVLGADWIRYVNVEEEGDDLFVYAQIRPHVPVDYVDITYLPPRNDDDDA